MAYTFRPFTEADIPAMHLTFLKAFSGYPLPFQLTYEAFVQKFIQKLNINLSLSMGAFDQEVLVGFIFTGIGTYQGKKTAYNGGTGVVPAHRGKALTVKMYDYLWPKLERKGVEQAVLEVLTTNETAIEAYQKCRFKIHNRFLCFQFKGKARSNRKTAEIRISKKAEADWALYETFFDYTPSYLDTHSVLNHNLSREYIAEATMDNTVVGYIIFQPNASRISQWAVKKEYRRQGIGTELLYYALELTPSNTITIININEKSTATISILKQMGFEKTVEQYEMKRITGE